MKKLWDALCYFRFFWYGWMVSSITRTFIDDNIIRWSVILFIITPIVMFLDIKFVKKYFKGEF